MGLGVVSCDGDVECAESRRHFAFFNAPDEKFRKEIADSARIAMQFTAYAKKKGRRSAPDSTLTDLAATTYGAGATVSIPRIREWIVQRYE